MSRAWEIPELDPKASVAANARRILAVRVAEFFSHESAIADPDAVTALHDARIAAKRLRYTLETFAFVFGDAGTAVVAEIRAWQDLLGEIHDLDVRIALVDSERAARGGRQDELDRSLAIVQMRVRGERARLHANAVEMWHDLIARQLRERLGLIVAPFVTDQRRDD